ncbi:MAG: phosphoserine phosphatase SerB [Reyranellaceae bacterium]
MEYVLTLIADPSRCRLEDTTARLVRDALGDLGGDCGAVEWLAPQMACDIGFEMIVPDQAEAAARRALGDLAVDVAAQPTLDRRKALLVADMESTIIENEMLDELADFLGLRERIAAITARAMNGEIDFADALRERVGLLKDLPASRLDEASRRIRVMPGAATLVATLKASGTYCALVSGGFTYFTAMVRIGLGFDVDRANRLEVNRDRLAGTVAEPILGREAKLDALTHLAAERHLPLTRCLAVGDGANDLPMLQAAGLGVAYRAKPAVAAACRVRVDHGDLTALLYLQGYRRDDFVVRPDTLA